MKNSTYRKMFLLTLMVLVFFSSIAAIKEYRRLVNLRVKGWLFGDTSWSKIVTWTYTGTLDTVAMSGVDTTCIVSITPIDSVFRYPLCPRISRNDDSIFVESDTSVFTNNKYSLIIIRP